MSGRGLDHLIEQNETELEFLSAYGGGESPEQLLEIIRQKVCDEINIQKHEEGVKIILKMENLPLVQSDINRRGFMHGNLDKSGVSVIITDFGPEQQRFVERLVEFIQSV